MEVHALTHTESPLARTGRKKVYSLSLGIFDVVLRGIWLNIILRWLKQAKSYKRCKKNIT